MNRVRVQMFHMVPIDAQGQPDPQQDPASCYGFAAYDDYHECCDYGMSLEKLQQLCRPDSVLDTLTQYNGDLADEAQSCGLYLNGAWIPAEELTLSDGDSETEEEDG